MQLELEELSYEGLEKMMEQVKTTKDDSFITGANAVIQAIVKRLKEDDEDENL